MFSAQIGAGEVESAQLSYLQTGVSELASMTGHPKNPLPSSLHLTDQHKLLKIAWPGTHSPSSPCRPRELPRRTRLWLPSSSGLPWVCSSRFMYACMMLAEERCMGTEVGKSTVSCSATRNQTTETAPHSR